MSEWGKTSGNWINITEAIREVMEKTSCNKSTAMFALMDNKSDVTKAIASIISTPKGE